MKRLLYFTADFCGPCKHIRPIVEELQSEFPITIVDAVNEKELSAKYSIRNVPAILLVENEEEISRLVGGRITKEQIVELYNK